MRITGGTARSIPLAAPKGDAVRPAMDRMRQAVFSSLASRLAGARFLDLYAGVGSYGLEAFSRGAAGGIFVEQNRAAFACLRANIVAVCKSMGAPSNGLSAVQSDVLAYLRGCSERVELAFIDPPYEVIDRSAPVLFREMDRLLVPDGLVIFEMPGEVELLPAGWEAIKRIGRGRRQPTCVLFRRAGKEKATDERGLATDWGGSY